ncbi:MAG: response regulator transcription factor, partial [Alphaproteobacteria bacterium]|nr:response regulator transcription factor [Alphaproteobacteria bacterium]
FLALENFDVAAIHDGSTLAEADLQGVDLIVLDVMLPHLSGFEVLKRLRQWSNLPVIMMTARDQDVDRIVGLEIGADDYLGKPVNPRELVARIRAILRRVDQNGPPLAGDVAAGEIRVNPTSREAWAGGEVLDLTTAEFNLLEHLIRNAGQVVSRTDLSAAAFGRSSSVGGTDRNVDTLVSKVRRKLNAHKAAETPIKTVRNAGYILAVPSPRDPRGPAT